MAELDIRAVAAVAYDFDGTLKDSIADHETARQMAFDAMAEAGDERFARIDQAVFDEAHHHGSNPTAIIGWILGQTGIVPSHDVAANPLTLHVVGQKREFYRELCEKGGKPVDGSLDFVRRMSVVRPGGEYIVTTAERQVEVWPFLIRHGLTRHFPDTRIVAHEHVERLKPDPQAYQIMLERAQLLSCPERALAIEDSTQGITAAKLAGLTVAAIQTTHTAEQLMGVDQSLRPDVVVSGFAELRELLQ